MPKLVIDDQQIEVAPRTKVIEAAARLGIMIPRFCYHPALGSIGACRVCAVKFLQGPIKGLKMSCMIEAQDGMIVSTVDAEAVDFRKQVIEWLMLNHPHDCPVCDEGGHCLLQDMTVAGGHGIRRYLGNKRTYTDQYLGPLLQHEMNRCIHCYRCARFYREFAGCRDLGVMQNANRTYFGRYEDGVLESPFSGNLSDICPTGVYTDKPSRFFGRRWDYQRSPSICINCSLGCHTITSVRYRELKRQEARYRETVNGYFICDRGRYGFFYNSREERPRRARAAGEEVSCDQALRMISEKLAKISKTEGPRAAACLSSHRSSLETQMMLKLLCRMKGWRNPTFFMDQTQAQNVKTAIARLEPQLRVSLHEVERADFVLAVGADPINEAPMLALAMRQAQRNGAKVVVLDPRPISLPFEIDHLPLAPADLSFYLGSFIHQAVDRNITDILGENTGNFIDAIRAHQAVSAADAQLSGELFHNLRHSQRPVVVCGTELVPEAVVGLAADFTLLLQASGKHAGLFYLLPGPNAFAGGLLSGEKDSFVRIIEEIENGSIRVLILAECDPFWCFCDRQRLEQALDKLDLLIVLDYLDSRASRKAHIFLPTSTLYESGGVFINQEGRVQAAARAFSGGIPIARTRGGDHPPRSYGIEIPGSEPKAAWLILARMGNGGLQVDEAKALENLWQQFAAAIPEFADISSLDQIAEDGFRISSGANLQTRFSVDWFSKSPKNQDDDDRFELLLVDWTFGTEELSSMSPCLWELEPAPCLMIHPDDAEDLDLKDGEMVEIRTDRGGLKIRMTVGDKMAPGILVMPRHRKLNWQIFGSGKIIVGKDQIKKRM